MPHKVKADIAKPGDRSLPGAELPTLSPAEHLIRPVNGRSHTYTEAIRDALFEFIVGLHLPAGFRLVEVELASSFGVSKTPVREALLGLRNDNLVVIEPHRGAFVSWMSFMEFEEIIFVLNALQIPALERIAALASPQVLKAVEREIGEMERARRDVDDIRYNHAFLRHHSLLFGAAGYPKLLTTVNSVNRTHLRYHRVFVIAHGEEWTLETQLVRRRFELVAAGDAEGAARLLRDFRHNHVERSRVRLREDIGGIARYFTDRGEGASGADATTLARSGRASARRGPQSARARPSR